MKIKDQTCWIFPVKMKSIDPNTGFNIEIKFFERNIVFEFEIRAEVFPV